MFPIPDMAPSLEDMENYGPFVYFIRWGEYIKIGTSICPSRRLAQINRGGRRRGTIPPPAPIGEPELIACTPGSALHERHLHQRFKHLRTDGEWFLVDDELRYVISEAHVRQMHIETEIAGVSDPKHPTYQEIFFRRFDQIERLYDPDMAHEFDAGPEYHEYY